MTKIPKIPGLFNYFFAGISGIFQQNPAPKRLRPALRAGGRRRADGRRADGRRADSAGRNEDSVGILGFWHFFVSRNPRNLRPGSSSLVSTSLTHSGDDEDSEDSGVILLFFCWNLRNLPPESPRTFIHSRSLVHSRTLRR